MHYRREIDGLRSIAVLPVILYHAGFEFFSGGFIGVDVFFVISGYLITSILIEELGTGRFSIVRFYERRARRILPALFVVCGACIPFAIAWMPPSSLAAFWKSIVAVVLFASNIFFWREDGYFAESSETKPLLHTWSLGVEEQYYLLFPIFLAIAWRFGRKPTFWLTVGLAVASLLLSQWASRNTPTANYYLIPTRAWEILAGSICAFLLSGRPQRESNALSLAGLVLLVFSLIQYDHYTPFPGFHALPPIVGTVLMILCAGPRTWVGRLLSLPVFTGIGLISYSAYLWHQPLFAFARLRSLDTPSPWLMGLLAALSLLLGYLSWRFVERPFRSGPTTALRSRRAVFAVAAAVGVALAGTGSVMALATQGAEIQRETTGGRCNVDRDDCFAVKNAKIRVALWGDSYADAFAQSLGRNLNRSGISLSLFIRHACPSLLGIVKNEDDELGVYDSSRCRDHNAQAMATMSSEHFDVVVLSSFYQSDAFAKNHRGEAIILDAGDPGKDQVRTTSESLARTAQAVARTGSRVIVVTDHPRVPDFAKARKAVLFEGADQIQADYASAAALRATMLAELRKSGVVYREIDGLKLFCHDRSCPVIGQDGKFLLYDGEHISTVLSPRLAAKIARIVRSRDSADATPVP